MSWRLGLVGLAMIGLLVLPSAVVAGGSQYIPTQGQGSWGLGIVVPERSGTAGPGVSWGTAWNVTTVFRVPDITNVSATIYAISSIMLEDGTVLQAAAGIYPGESSWLSYSMYIYDLSQQPQTYNWSLNSSIPVSMPGEDIAISIFLDQGKWSFSLENLQTRSRVALPFGVDGRSAPMNVDQEVFALESYTSDSASFSKMGNLTLRSVQVNGQAVEGGWYAYGDWSMGRGPPYVVGGLPPPPFMGLKISGDGSASWYYAWGVTTPIMTVGPTPMTLGLAIGAGAGLGLAAVLVAGRAASRRVRDVPGERAPE